LAPCGGYLSLLAQHPQFGRREAGPGRFLCIINLGWLVRQLHGRRPQVLDSQSGGFSPIASNMSRLATPCQPSISGKPRLQTFGKLVPIRGSFRRLAQWRTGCA
jgi:hypothetical protein